VRGGGLELSVAMRGKGWDVLHLTPLLSWHESMTNSLEHDDDVRNGSSATAFHTSGGDRG
jgi:hypothetical protein